MKTVVCPRSGPPEVMRYTEFAKLVPEANEIPVRVRCATITSGDVKVRRIPRALLAIMGYWIAAGHGTDH